MYQNYSALDLFISAYLNTKSRSNTQRIFVEKALALVDEKLGVPCCLDPDATIELYTRFDNDLTNGVRMMLAGLPRKGNVQSLNRAHRILYKFLHSPCCV